MSLNVWVYDYEHANNSWQPLDLQEGESRDTYLRILTDDTPYKRTPCSMYWNKVILLLCQSYWQQMSASLEIIWLQPVSSEIARGEYKRNTRKEQVMAYTARRQPGPTRTAVIPSKQIIVASRPAYRESPLLNSFPARQSPSLFYQSWQYFGEFRRRLYTHIER